MEIKFRAKVSSNNRWIYGGYYEHINRQICPMGDSLKDEDITPLIITSGFADWNMERPVNIFEVDKNTVGQFTNICDKNSKEIYDGDIVKVRMNDGSYENYYITYNENEACFEALNKDKSNFILPEVWRESEVIGNIYDNRELLGG